MSAAEARPLPQARVASLDVLRGIAILGTLSSNGWLFAVPGGALVWLAGGLAPHGPVEAGLKMLSNGFVPALGQFLGSERSHRRSRGTGRSAHPTPR